MEDLAISLILGLDLDDENNLLISESSPVFNKEAGKSSKTFETKALSIRDSRIYFDAMAAGKITAAKIQVLLIGKRILEHEDWFPILDTIYRNPAFSINTRTVAVDGAVSDIIFYQPEDKPLLPQFLKRIIDDNTDRTKAVVSTLQMLHREMYDKGVTPALPEFKKGKEIQLTGTALLNKRGKYVGSLDLFETSLLLLLQKEKNNELTLSFPLKEVGEESGVFHKNELSIDVLRTKVKIKTSHEEDRFHLDYRIKMNVNIVERLFPDTGEDLSQLLETELKRQFTKLIQRIQDHKIDPIGLGVYARAFEYEQFKKVEDNWGESLAKAKIDVTLDIDIKSVGATN